MNLKELTATQLMSDRLITVKHSDSLIKAFQIMKEERIRHLPVTGKGGEIVGILSDRDVQRAMKPQNSLEIPDDFEVSFDANHQVGDFMSWPVISVAPQTPVKEVLKKVLENKVSAVLVARSAGRYGLITSEDLLALLLTVFESSAPDTDEAAIRIRM